MRIRYLFYYSCLNDFTRFNNHEEQVKIFPLISIYFRKGLGNIAFSAKTDQIGNPWSSS